MSGGQARPEASLLEELKAEVILTPDGIAYAYNTGVFLSSEQSQDTVAVAIIACVEDRFLVAVPGSSWNRKADKRKLPPGTLQKAISLSVAGCAADSREEAADGISIHIWVGWLKKESRSALDFSGEDAPTIDFVDKDTEEQCFPLADALVEVAQEKFQVSSASPEFVGPERITALEEKFAAMQASMTRLIEIHEGKGDAGFATADEGSSGRMYPTAPKSAAKATLAAKAKVRTQPAPHAPPPGLASLHAYPGLDPGVVASALQAGIPPEHLQTMSNVLKSGPAKLEDYPRSGAPLQQAHPVSDEEDVEEPAPPTMGDPMADAVVKLTQIMAKITKPAQTSSSLEETLDQVGGGGSGSGDVSSAMGRKHAAARRGLQKAFQEDASQIWRSVEANMAQDFNLQTSLPNASMAFTARGWCEHRSKIQPYIRTCRWIWGISGILDDLRTGQNDRAHARCCLLLAAAEQESLDHGSFLLSQEFLMEPAVPLSSFQSHVLPDTTEMATTRLLDPRWIEAFADRLKQLDTYVEMRRKLTLRSRGQGQSPSQPAEAAAKSKGSQKGKGKKKGREGEADSVEGQ